MFFCAKITLIVFKLLAVNVYNEEDQVLCFIFLLFSYCNFCIINFYSMLHKCRLRELSIGMHLYKNKVVNYFDK